MKSNKVFVYNPETFAADLRSLRSARQVSRYKIVHETGICYNTLNYLESGTRKPTIGLLVKLLKTLGVEEIRIEVPGK